jgi:hypothetical protein
LRRDRRGDGLERAHAAFTRSLAVQGEVAEKLARAHSKFKNLHQMQARRKIRAGAAK